MARGLVLADFLNVRICDIEESGTGTWLCGDKEWLVLDDEELIDVIEDMLLDINLTIAASILEVRPGFLGVIRGVESCDTWTLLRRLIDKFVGMPEFCVKYAELSPEFNQFMGYHIVEF